MAFKIYPYPISLYSLIFLDVPRLWLITIPNKINKFGSRSPFFFNLSTRIFLMAHIKCVQSLQQSFFGSTIVNRCGIVFPPVTQSHHSNVTLRHEVVILFPRSCNICFGGLQQNILLPTSYAFLSHQKNQYIDHVVPIFKLS